MKRKLLLQITSRSLHEGDKSKQAYSEHILDVAITQRCLRTDCRLTTDVPHTLILTEQPADFPAKMPFQTMHINLLTRTHVSS